jgi:hypothetical protein
LLMVSLSAGGRESHDNLKDRADNDVVEEDMILSSREHEQKRAFVAESPMAKRLLLEIIRCLAWRVAKERGESDSSKLGELFRPK